MRYSFIMRRIPLTKGRVVLVDEEDYAWLSTYRWYCQSTQGGQDYACRRVGNKLLLMHRAILRPAPNQLVDHRSGDTLDCRRANMRLCTKRQNQCNQKLRRDNTSGYKGIFRHKKSWSARVYVNGKAKWLGTFNSREQAAVAYNEGARHYYGEFAKLNVL